MWWIDGAASLFALTYLKKETRLLYCTWRVLAVGLEISISLWNSWGNTASKYDDLFFWILLILSQNQLHFNRYDNGIYFSE